MLPTQSKEDLRKELKLRGCGAQVTQYDEYLVPYTPQLQSRYAALELLKHDVCFCFVLFFLPFVLTVVKILANEGGLDRFSRGYELFGFRVGGGGISFREYAPAAVSVTLIGDFSEYHGP